MGEPLTRRDTETAPDETGRADALLSQAAQRLERALAALEAAFTGRPLLADGDAARAAQDERSEALVIELGVARRRQHALSEAAADASAALGRAMAQVRRTLEEDAERQGVLDLMTHACSDDESQGLEVQAGSPEEGAADPRPPEEEPTA